MNGNKQVLKIEAPDRSAVVDFLDHGVSVRLEVSGDKLVICVSATVGDQTSNEIKLEDFEFGLPEFAWKDEEEDANS